MKSTYHGVYVDMDALFDTRLASLLVVSEHLLPPVLASGYFHRMEDSFKEAHPGLTKKKFAELYASRNNEVLHASSYTKVLRVLQEAVQKLFHQKLETPHVTGICIYVNMHPFKLTEDEEGFLARALIHLTNGAAEVEFVNLPKEELTPRLCNEHFSAMIKYDYAEWLDYHAGTNALKQTPLTTITLMVPELFFARMPTADELNRMRKGSFDPFDVMEKIFAPVVHLKILPLDTFCVDANDKRHRSLYDMMRKAREEAENAPPTEPTA